MKSKMDKDMDRDISMGMEMDMALAPGQDMDMACKRFWSDVLMIVLAIRYYVVFPEFSRILSNFVTRMKTIPHKLAEFWTLPYSIQTIRR